MEATVKWSAIVILSAILGACSTGDQMTLPRAAVATGNVEMIGNGLETFLGHDGSGTEAMDYVKPFAAEVEEIYRDYQRSLRTPISEDRPPEVGNQLALLYRAFNPPNQKPPDMTAQYVNRLDGIARIALLRMDSCYDAYTRTSEVVTAKKAFAAGFFALQGKAYKDPIQKKMTEIYDGIVAYYAQKGLPK